MAQVKSMVSRSTVSDLCIDTNAADESRRARNERRRARRIEIEEEKERHAAKVAPVLARLEAERAEEERLYAQWDDDEDDDDCDLRALHVSTMVAPPAVAPARFRMRHIAIVMSFLLLVVAPIALVATYLFTRAADQYVSDLAFSVRSEEQSSAFDLIGGLANLGRSGTSDTDVLFDYIRSGTIVREANADLDLAAIWSKPQNDPYFAFSGDTAIENLADHWTKMVKVFYDNSSNIIEVKAHAFDPKDAQALNREILDKSSQLINQLSSIAREDSTRYARADLEQAIESLKAARSAIARFRSENLILDPNAEAESRLGVVTKLQQELADSLIDNDLLLQATKADDPRVRQVQTRIDVIRRRIEAERLSMVGGATASTTEKSYSQILDEFEGLWVEKEFAEQAYVTALASFNMAIADAGRKTRYVAAHIPPTLPERSSQPHRFGVLAIFSFFDVLAWAIAVLVFYAIRDRR